LGCRPVDEEKKREYRWTRFVEVVVGRGEEGGHTEDSNFRGGGKEAGEEDGREKGRRET